MLRERGDLDTFTAWTVVSTSRSKWVKQTDVRRPLDRTARRQGQHAIKSTAERDRSVPSNLATTLQTVTRSLDSH